MKIRFQADEDLNQAIVRAVRRRQPQVDFASPFDSLLIGLADPEVLSRAASAGRVLVTHDRRTMVEHFRERISRGESTPGLLLVSQSAAIGEVVESLFLLWNLAQPEDLAGQVLHLPSFSRHAFSD